MRRHFVLHTPCALLAMALLAVAGNVAADGAPHAAADASTTTADAPARDDSLYRALGGEQGVATLVEALLQRVYADERIAFLFAEADRNNLARLIREQFCNESGGPCAYSGRSMAESHSGLGLKEKEFDAFVEDFIDAMEDARLPYRTQNRMLKIFAPMRPDILHK
ncbi:hemoglobin [Tahibacter aquaticus]|uniref:Hemoglobin n=1 Tax=Tahibacter aquaticus TaxID=520092 RepID=A0A4R6YPD2_9GAMM|nr:group 1 truncated hemoglobin [Tahibacter aquaticus]TDR39412.1 hemoglobin [Tahibacter aquaticus]